MLEWHFSGGMKNHKNNKLKDWWVSSILHCKITEHNGSWLFIQSANVDSGNVEQFLLNEKIKVMLSYNHSYFNKRRIFLLDLNILKLCM